MSVGPTTGEEEGGTINRSPIGGEKEEYRTSEEVEERREVCEQCSIVYTSESK